MTELSRDQRAEALARDILALARNTLLVNFRFLDRAVSRLTPAPAESVRFGTDGEYLYFDPWYVLSVYRSEQTAVARDYLHCLLHCIFRHPYTGPEIDTDRWDLACDIAAEAMISSLGKDAVRAGREAMQQGTLALLKDELDGLSAERICAWLEKHGFSPEELRKQREAFAADSHGLWYGSREDARTDRDIDLRELWEQISRRMQTELETVENSENAILAQNLRALNRPRQSYSEFLRRFGVHGEVMRLSEEEFDYNYYAHGMDLYGNIPLIEPLEYREERRIRDFVIAIDTSGSVSGEVVQSFVQRTHDLLMRQESFFTKVRIHIIQCDDCIREDVCITCREDFERYLSSMKILGLGQTDFRPVFARTDELLRAGEFSDFRGLLYFTDGEGIFPSARPDYDTAFILHCSEFGPPPLPSWAMSLILTEDEILDKRFASD